MQVCRAFEGGALAGRVSLSIGIALCPEHGARYDELFKAADSALYLVKARGRGAYRMY